MNKYAPYSLFAVSLLCATPSFADLAQLELASLEYPGEPIGPSVAIPDSFIPVMTPPPLEKQGKWLDDHGVSPHLGLTQFYLANPGVGTDTGNHESLTLFDVGVNVDLEKILGWHGTRLHFNELYVPYRNNLDFGAQAGDVLSSKSSPYIPRVSHLTLFTLEQKLLQDQLTVEGGISNAGNYFALPLCNVGLGCTTLPDAAGANPSPYANWGARLNYQFTPALSAQVGTWRVNDAYPFANGWERGAGSSGGNMSTTYLANVAYRTDFSTTAYPQSYELVGFHNTRDGNDPYYTTAGTAQLSDSAHAPATTNGLNGFYLGLKKTFWRADGGQSKDMTPTALSAYFAGSHVFEEDVPNGIPNQVSTGLILSAPFKSRPYDTYSLSAHWVQLSDHEQKYINAAYRSVGQDYTSPGGEYALELDANLILTRGVVVSPYVMYTWDPINTVNPFDGIAPKAGVSAGFLFHVQLESFLGLDSGMHR